MKEDKEDLIAKCPRHKGVMTNYSQVCNCGGLDEKEIEHAELKCGIVQALAERERILGIIEPYKNHSSHNPNDTCLEEIIKEIENV